MDNQDAIIRGLFSAPRTIALVGASPKPERPSHYVGQFLVAKGHRVIGVNPGLVGQALYGEPVYAQLADISDDVDMIDIFRQSQYVADIVDEALGHWPRLAAIWMQLGVTDAGAAAQARARGVPVIMDRCPKIEYPRLGLG